MIGLGSWKRQMTLKPRLLDDLANTVALGEHIRLLGRLSRVFPYDDRLHYSHGIRFEVNNVLREPDCRQATVPDEIAAIIYSKSKPLKVESSYGGVDSQPTLHLIFKENTSAWNTSQAIVDLLGEL